MKNRVRQLREEQGLTGKFDPSLWLAYDIAQLFNKSIEEVFDFKESERK